MLQQDHSISWDQHGQPRRQLTLLCYNEISRPTGQNGLLLPHIWCHNTSKKTSLSTEKGEKTLFWENPDPFLGFPVGSRPEQSFLPLVLLIIEITQNPSHVTLFLEGILLLYYKTSRFCVLSCLLSFSGGAKNLEATDGGLNLFFPETMTTFTSSHRLK